MSSHSVGCRYCKGDGSVKVSIDGVWTDQVCPVCGGAGTMIIQENTVSCRYCKGSGKDKVSIDGVWTDQVCSVCGGTGRVNPRR